MCKGSERGYGGHEGSRAVTLRHDAGQRFKFMGWY